VPFPAGRVPWSAAEGALVLAAFLAIQCLAGALAAGPALRWAVANCAVLLAVHLFLRVRAGGAPQAQATIGLRVRRPLRALRRSLVPLAVGVSALALWWALLWRLMRYMNWRPPEQAPVRLIRACADAGDVWQLGVLVLVAAVVAPAAEELVFRGVLYLPLRASWGPTRAALGVSALFAAVHLYPAGLGQLFILALVLTWLMEATGTIVAPMLAHAGYNAAMIAVILLTS